LFFLSLFDIDWSIYFSFNQKEYRKYLRAKNHCFFPDLEDELDAWISRERAKGSVITGSRILVEAKLIAQRKELKSFMGSNGWLCNFLKRKSLSLRKINSKNKDLPLNVSSTLKKFHEQCQEKRQHYRASQILNADETNVELDSPSDYTYDKKGAKKVCAKTTGRHKTKLSIMVCASANGDKLMPVFTIPRKRKLKDEPRDCIVVYKGRSKTFDSTVICDEFLGKSVASYMTVKGFDKAMLAWDGANPHKTQQTKRKLKDLHVDPVDIPPRTTAFSQPADLMWFKEIKSKYHEKWTGWWLNDRKACTKNGNLKSPGYVKAMKWFLEAWNELDIYIIKDSFEKTGITCSNPENFNSVLKYVLENSYLPGSVVVEDEDCDEIKGFTQDGDESSDDDSSFNSEDESSESDEFESGESDESDSCESGSGSESESGSGSESESDSMIESGLSDDDIEYESYTGAKCSKNPDPKRSKIVFYKFFSLKKNI
jgi:hypothetical protein